MSLMCNCPFSHTISHNVQKKIKVMQKQYDYKKEKCTATLCLYYINPAPKSSVYGDAIGKAITLVA
jgi:hypothetical protein